MLSDLHDSLTAMLERAVGANSGIAVLFGTPALAAESTARPALSLWLADIREDRRNRASDWSPTRDDQGVVTGWRPPYRYYTLSYLLTVWATRESDEADLLGQVLRHVGGCLALPNACRRGWLKEERLPVTLDVANPPYSLWEGWTVWSALGIGPHCALHLVVTVPVRSDEVAEAAPPVAGRRLTLTAPVDERALVVQEEVDPGRRDTRLQGGRYGVIAREWRSEEVTPGAGLSPSDLREA
jgi:hypothetical protein